MKQTLAALSFFKNRLWASAFLLVVFAPGAASADTALSCDIFYTGVGERHREFVIYEREQSVQTSDNSTISDVQFTPATVSFRQVMGNGSTWTWRIDRTTLEARVRAVNSGGWDGSWSGECSIPQPRF